MHALAWICFLLIGMVIISEPFLFGQKREPSVYCSKTWGKHLIIAALLLPVIIHVIVN